MLDVRPGSPAAAGLGPAMQNRQGVIEPNDLVVGVGERRVATSSNLRAALDRHVPGDAVDLVVERDGREVRVPVVLNAPR